MSIKTYLKETRGEMKHIVWPSRKETITTTLVVIALSIVTALILGLFDYGFAQTLKAIVS
jgi:preprotein translocase subunit SecE